MGEVPKEGENFEGHHTVFVILSQAADQLKQFLPLSVVRICPRGLETLKEVVELVRRKVPRQLCQEVVHVLHDRLVLPHLTKQNTNQLVVVKD